jgi:hypothetical protein
MPAPEHPSLIVRQQSPPNIEFPFASLSEWLVPTDLFFVRNHFPLPPKPIAFLERPGAESRYPARRGLCRRQRRLARGAAP